MTGYPGKWIEFEEDSVLVANTTEPMEMTSSESTYQYLTVEQTHIIMQILMLGVTPGICVLGIVGNIFSIMILLKHGLHKCSNVLLLVLAASDISFMISFNSIPRIIYELFGTPYGFDYPESTARFFFVMYLIFHTLDYATGSSSLSLPVLITLERLIAVYLPLKYSKLATPRKGWIGVGLIFLYWCGYIIYSQFWFGFEYSYDPARNRSIGLIVRSALYARDKDVIYLLNSVYFNINVPPALTLIGCICIAVKLKITSSKRKKMTTMATSSTSKTTKMLLAVCAVYIVACVVISMPNYLPGHFFYTLTNDTPSNLATVLYQVINIVLCINSSCNFVVYVGMNKNFRDTFKSFFTGCCKTSRNISRSRGLAVK